MTREISGSSALVVGGAGFVGSNVCRRLLADGIGRVVVIDNLLSAERWNLPEDPRLEFTLGSVADDAVLSSVTDEFDFVFHLATFHGNQNSIARPIEDHDNNTITTLKLSERLKGFKRLQALVYASAGCSLGEMTAGGAKISREDALLPLFFDSPYQISKILGELYLNYYFSRYGLPAVKTRFQNVYGPGEILGAGSWRGTSATVWRNVTPVFIYRALKGLPLRVDSEEASRDFIHVTDIVDGLIRAAVRGRAGESYNLGTGVETRIADLARTVCEQTQSTSQVTVGEQRAWDHSVRRAAATDKSERELGFKTAVEIESGLAQTIAWTRENLQRIDQAISKHKAFMSAEESPTA